MEGSENNYSLEPYLEPDIRDPGKKFIPTKARFNKLKKGNIVMVKFSNNKRQAEQLLVKIISIGTDNLSFVGRVNSKPKVLTSPKEGAVVTFGARNISGILP